MSLPQRTRFKGAASASVAKLGWYGRRLRTMDKHEMLWRASKALLPAGSTLVDTKRAIQCCTTFEWERELERFRSGTCHPAILNRVSAEVVATHCPDLVAQLIDAADAVSERNFQFFGYPPVALGEPIDWHSDPVAGIRWPAVASKRINHRDAGGDVKWVWELNRLQHLPWLAQAWLFTGDDRYSRAALAQLDSWIEQNPPGQGIAWRGAFEVGVRAISIAVALQGLRDSQGLTVERYQRIVEMLAQSASRCESERSRFSSANNHLIGEMAGLAVVSILLPQLPNSTTWERKAIATLSAEAEKQILADGSGAEQAIGYQVFIAELLHVVAVLLEVRGDGAPQQIVDALSRSSAYLAALVGPSDPSPRYGDDDEGFALRLGQASVRTIREHLGILAPFDWGTSGACAATDSLDAQWFRAILPSSPSGRATGETTEKPRELFARDGGMVVLRSGSRRITMDVGPLGYLSIAAHGHADALAVTLSDGGLDLIGDPGTGSYYGHVAWRAVMRGTRAHPTVCVDGLDQSVSGGPFLWSRHARTRIRRVDLAAGVVDAEHDGYRRLRGNVIHRRWLVAPQTQRTHLVVDMVAGQGVHEVRTTWPLHPSLDVDHVDAGYLLRRSGSPVLQMLHTATARITYDDARGDESRNLGWWSDRLESRVPTWWLATVCTDELPVIGATLFSPMDGIRTSDLEVRYGDGRIEVSWREGRCQRTVTLNIGDSAVASHVFVDEDSQE